MGMVQLRQRFSLLAGSSSESNRYYNDEIAQGGLLPMNNQDQWMQG